jgi:hypothetical protein
VGDTFTRAPVHPSDTLVEGGLMSQTTPLLDPCLSKSQVPTLKSQILAFDLVKSQISSLSFHKCKIWVKICLVITVKMV